MHVRPENALPDCNLVGNCRTGKCRGGKCGIGNAGKCIRKVKRI